MNLFASIKTLLTSARVRVTEEVRAIPVAYAEGKAEYEAKHPKPEARRYSCDTCGSTDMDETYANSHAKCRACGATMRKDIATYERHDDTVQQLPTPLPRYIKSTFRNSLPCVVEYELRAPGVPPDVTKDKEVGITYVTAQGKPLNPKPVPFVGIRAGRVN